MHWNDQFASSARINAVVNPATDPVSGQPELKHTPVRIEPIAVAWHGLLLSRARPAAVFGEHWSRCAGNGHEQWRLAGSQAPENWSARAHDLLGAASGAEHREWIEFEDRAAGRYRAALLRDGRLETCLFIACSAAALPDTLWLGALFRDEPLSAKDRATLLTGRPARSARRAGAVVCACHGIGRGAIVEAISAGADSVDAIGASCKAGTECGSCRSELRALLCSARRAASARSAAQGESV
jgi:assimilatory nitrate reductase catalytic subunit